MLQQGATELLLAARTSIYITFTNFHISCENSWFPLYILHFPIKETAIKKFTCIAFPSRPISSWFSLTL